MTLGGLQDRLQKGDDPRLLVEQVANSINASVLQPLSDEAEPHPPDILAMIKLADFFYRTEGDVRQTVLVPQEILCKPIDVECKDTEAKKVWEQLWKTEDAPLDIDHLYEQSHQGVERHGQWFPLEVWDDAGKQPVGIAIVEPSSMWVGRHVSHTGVPLSIEVPSGFDMAKLKSQIPSIGLFILCHRLEC